jgi:hypothetical protein
VGAPLLRGLRPIGQIGYRLGGPLADAPAEQPKQQIARALSELGHGGIK